MPKPYEFRSEIELIESLQNPRTYAAATRFFSSESPTVAHVVHTGVGGNTFRAFRKLPVQPSKTFRSWATGYVLQSLHTLATVADASTYTGYVHDATLALCDHWRQVAGSEMGYGRGAKLFNLVLKKLACLRELPHEQKCVLISLQHVPLDSYTIVGLRSAAPDLAIPKSATMKFIASRPQYTAIQDRISAIAAKAGVPPIYYDVLAWDMGH